MSAVHPNASWNPAFRPDSASPSPKGNNDENDSPSPALQPSLPVDELEKDDIAELEAWDIKTIAVEEAADASPEWPATPDAVITPEDDTSLPHDVSNDNVSHPELDSLRKALEASLASEGGVEMDDNPKHGAETTGEDAQDNTDSSYERAEMPSSGPRHVGGHGSNVSFTRTVGHDVDWGEEDEVDPAWILGTKDSDPFQSMPSSDRTNSFPSVPPAHTATGNTAAPEYPHSQAEDTLFRDNNNVEAESISLKQNKSSHKVKQSIDWGNEFDGDDFNFGMTAGGDVTENGADAGHYEEGVPLVRNAHLDARVKSHQKKFSTSKFFADDVDDAADGFFSSIKEDTIPEATTPLDRKSTPQVLDSMHYESQGDVNGATSDEHGGRRLSSVDMTTGGGIAASQSTLLSQVMSQEGGEIREGPDEASSIDAPKPSEEDLSAKWKAALDADEFLDDDEGFLPDEAPETITELDPAAVFGSDDEGFLEDDEVVDAEFASVIQDQGSPVPKPVIGADGNLVGFDRLTDGAQQKESSTRNRYLPLDASQVVPPQPKNSYAPTTLRLTDLTGQINSSTPYGAIHPAAVGSRPGSSGYQAQFQVPQVPIPDLAPKAQSFADKAKGGYASPYDLPMDVTKPKKRVSMQHMAGAYAQPSAPTAPPRSTSMHVADKQPLQSPSAITSPPITSRPLPPLNTLAHVSPSVVSPPRPTLKSKESFFEELPVVAKQRSSRPPSQPISPGQPSFGVSAPFAGPPAAPPQAVPPQQQFVSPPITHGLVSPPPLSPYAHIATQAPKAAPVNTRYSPALSQQQATVPVPPPQARYTATPPLVRQTIPAYSAAPLPPNPPFAHQPRTSSPLAQFERSSEQEYPSAPPSHTAAYGRTTRRESSSYSNSSRDGHMPLAREVAEHAVSERRRSHDQGISHAQEAAAAIYQAALHQTSLSRTYEPTSTPPIRRAMSYAPENREPLPEVEEPPFQPPKRSQTQSPGTAANGPRTHISVGESYARPSSVQSPTSPPRTSRAYAPISPEAPAPKPRGRGFSQGLNYIAPTDGRQHDPLQRWRGWPVFAWGAAGTVITTFPKEIPRYAMGSSVPMIQPSPGEVKIRNMKDIYPLEGPAANFPGPLKGKGKKKEVLSWLSSGIDALERGKSHLGSLPSITHDDKRKEERILLWKILRVLIEHDGALEGNAEVDKAVSAILFPELDANSAALDLQYEGGLPSSGIYRAPGSIPLAEPVDPVAVDEVRKQLMRGDREKAVWTAVDNRLWAHAMLISNTLSADLYKRVAQEFIQKEVKQIGENTESLAALYEVFAGNHEESIDELVPPSARAGFQMISASGTGPSKSAIDGLDRWRETLGLVLSNRSVDDNRAIQALGKLLAGYGRAEAAHICFLFARSHSLFAGIDDPNSNIVLIGSDHQRQPYDFDKDLESIQLTEVYEYGLSLSGASNIPMSVPHLAAYKLQHAKILAGFGQRGKALEYCENIATSVTSQTKRSPYHNHLLVSELDDLSKRLKQSPKDESSSWISKPSIDKVSSSVWTKFNKFVAGDENEDAQSSGADGAESGPFARIAGGTPTISRSPSVADIYGQHNQQQGMPNGSAMPIPTGKASRYAPGNSYSPANPLQPAMGSSYGSQPGGYGPNLGQQSSGFQGQPEQSGYDSQAVSFGSYESRYGPISHPEYPAAPQQQSTYSPTSPPEQSPQYQGGYSAGGQDYYASEPSHSHPPKPEYRQPQDSVQEASESRRISEEVISFGGYAPPSIPSYEPPAIPSYETPSSNSYEPPSNAYEPPSSTSYEPPISTRYAPPEKSYSFPEQASYTPPEHGGYTPPSYEPNQMNDEPESPINTKPKKKTFMDDEDEDTTPHQPREKTKAEKDREADEAFRKAAEEDGKLSPSPSFSLYLHSLMSTQQNAPPPPPPKRKAGASLAGSPRKKPPLPKHSRNPANPSRPSSARRRASTMTPI